MIKNILIILLLGIVLVAGCTQIPPNDNGFQEKEIPFDTVDKDVNSIIQARAQKVIQNSEDFQKLLNEIGSLKLLVEPDFSKYTVIAVFQGQKLTGGYSIEINKVKETRDKIQVYIIETFPDPNDVVTQALTSPYHIITIAKTNKEFEFNNLAQNGDKPPLPPKDDNADEVNYKEVQLNKEFTLKVGESAILKEDDLRIKFLEVTSYGLCPIDVQCIRLGAVFIKIDARYDNEKNLGIYTLRYGDDGQGGEPSVNLIPSKYRNDFSSPKAHNIKFVRIETSRDVKLGQTLDQSEYTAVFEVTLAETL